MLMTQRLQFRSNPVLTPRWILAGSFVFLSRILPVFLDSCQRCLGANKKNISEIVWQPFARLSNESGFLALRGENQCHCSSFQKAGDSGIHGHLKNSEKYLNETCLESALYQSSTGSSQDFPRSKLEKV
jgi:hypothetical protein